MKMACLLTYDKKNLCCLQYFEQYVNTIVYKH